jgi:predicted P-loop ATPase
VYRSKDKVQTIDGSEGRERGEMKKRKKEKLKQIKATIQQPEKQ